MKLLVLLKCSIVLAAGILFTHADAAQLPIGAEYRVGGFVLGCQAYTFHRFTAFEAIEKTAAAGGKAIEFYPGQSLSLEDKKSKVDANATDETIEKLKAKAKQHGLLIVNFGVVGIPKDEAGARKVFDFAKKLGVPAITIEPSPDQIDLIEKLIKEYDIAAGIHCHPKRANKPDYKLWNPNYVLSLVKDRDQRFGVCADVGHWTRSSVDAVAGLKIFEGRVISVHLKDIVESGNPDARRSFPTRVKKIRQQYADPHYLRLLERARDFAQRNVRRHQRNREFPPR